MAYNNVSRIGTGIRSTTSINPRALAEDISNKIHILQPSAAPIDSILKMIGSGAKPKNHRVTSVLYHEFDPVDFCSQTVMDTNLPAGFESFARLRLDQPSRPLTNDQMWYAPGDKLYIVATGQTVTVYATPTDSYELTDNAKFSDGLNGGLTGGTATTTQKGWVLVKNVEQAPLIPFSTSYVNYIGNWLRESQRITTPSRQRDVLYDYNLVEHKDATVVFTEDQATWVQTRFSTPEFDFQQKQTLLEFKRAIEDNLMFSERAMEFTDPSKPRRSLRGLLKHIETNVAYYNPHGIIDFEALMQNFILSQAYRFNPNGNQKVAVCGGGFLAQFNQTFASQRRIEQISDGKVSLDLDTYDFTGYNLKLTRSDVFAQDTPMWYWCVVIDPLEAERRMVKDFATKPQFANNDERDMKFMVEWQGTVAWNLEQAHAVLRTA